MTSVHSPCLIAVLGIDMSKAKFNAHLLLPADGGSHSGEFANTAEGFKALGRWLKKHSPKGGTLHAGVEATGNYALPLLMQLHQAGHRVSYLNPRRVKDFTRSLGRKAKTDPVDARDIALMVERLRPSLWTPPTVERCELQALVRHRRDLVAQVTANGNRLKTAQSPAVKSSLQQLLKHLRQQLKAIETQISNHTLTHNSLQRDERLLRSIPGFGRTVSAAVLGELPRLEDFTRAREVVAFAGMAPTVTTSGSSVQKRGRMSKEGSPLLRQMLYMAALNTITRPTALSPFYQALVARGKSKACALGALMNKLLRIAFGVLKHQTPFVENFAKI